MLHDNAKPHTSLKTMEYVGKFGWTVLSHNSYSLDLAPSDFPLFWLMKDGVCGQHFPDDDVITAVRKCLSAAGDCYKCSL